MQITNIKHQIPNKFQTPMTENQNKIYDLEDRTFLFAKSVSIFCKNLSKNISNIEYMKQLIRSSASVGANYIEANESLGKKDFQMRIKISRKEAKETAYWLKLIMETNDEFVRKEGTRLLHEAVELKKIFSSILSK